MAELFAALACEPSQRPNTCALFHLAQSWAALAWTTALLERHGITPGELEGEAEY